MSRKDGSQLSRRAWITTTSGALSGGRTGSGQSGVDGAKVSAMCPRNGEGVWGSVVDGLAASAMW